MEPGGTRNPLSQLRRGVLEHCVLSLLATVGGALYRMATVPVLDDAGRLTRQSSETVAAIRRWLMAHPEGPGEPGPH